MNFVVDSRLRPFVIDVDFLKILVVDCRPKGQKNLIYIYADPSINPPSIVLELHGNIG